MIMNDYVDMKLSSAVYVMEMVYVDMQLSSAIYVMEMMYYVDIELSSAIYIMNMIDTTIHIKQVTTH